MVKRHRMCGDFLLNEHLKQRLLVLVAAIIVGCAPAQGLAATWHVTGFGAKPDDGEDDAVAIQTAIDRSAEGDTVFLPAGNLLIGRTLKPKSGVRIQGAGRERTVLKFNATRSMDMFDLSGKRRVELDDFTIEGNRSTNAHHGIFAHRGGGHLVHHLTIQHLGSVNGPLGIHFTGDGGNYTNGVTDCILADNIIREIGLQSAWGGGIRLSWGSSRNKILRNVVDNTGRGGIFANDGSTDLVIRSNLVTRSGSKAEKLGIEIWKNCDRVVIEDNAVDHWLSIGGGRWVAVRRNMVRPSASDIAFIGLEMIGQDVVVTDNLIDGSQQIGFSVSNNASNQWHFCAYNTVQHMVQWGAQLQGDKTGARMLYYYRNKFLATQRGNRAAIYPGADGRGFRFNGNCQQITLDHNEISRNPAEGIELGGRGLDQISIIGNTITGNGFAAVSGQAGPDFEWADNIVMGNGKDTRLASRGFRNRKPQADFTYPSKAVTGQPADFTNKSVAPDGRIEHVLWDFGEDVPSTEYQGRHTYSRAGIYRVTVVVWDNYGRGAIQEHKVEVRDSVSGWAR